MAFEMVATGNFDPSETSSLLLPSVKYFEVDFRSSKFFSQCGIIETWI